MRRHPVGFRYAKAMFEYASEKNTLDQTIQELELISQVFEKTGILDEVFNHPKMTNEQKKQIVDNSLSNEISQGTLNLLHILINKNRIAFFPAIVDNLKAL